MNKASNITIKIKAAKNTYHVVVLSLGIVMGLGAFSFTTVILFGMMFTGFPWTTFLVMGLFFAFGFGFVFVLKNWLWMLFGKEIVSFDKNQINVVYKNALFKRNKVYLNNKVQNFRIKISKTTTLESSSMETNPWAGTIKAVGLDKKITIVRFQFDYDEKNIRIADGISEDQANKILHDLLDRKFLLTEQIAAEENEYFVRI